ncbi:MAG: C40 family peptidase [Chitinophagaceae bacterium]|nr:C40 family peptidase [Chitinophagaceae bacterium]
MNLQNFLLKIFYFPSILWVMIGGCFNSEEQSILPANYDSVTLSPVESVSEGSENALPPVKQNTSIDRRPGGPIETGATKAADVVAYSKTLIGVPYKYASTDPTIGFDCSGFITYVFNHFNIGVPRSSVDFTNVGTEVPSAAAKPGDLILFTGTDSTIRVVGHMGIIVNNKSGALEFIHSTSGKAKGVVITPFERYYQGRFVKVIRVFPAIAF